MLQPNCKPTNLKPCENLLLISCFNFYKVAIYMVLGNDCWKCGKRQRNTAHIQRSLGSHDFLIAKLEAYELDIGNRNFQLHYFSFRKKRPKVGFSYRKYGLKFAKIYHNFQYQVHYYLIYSSTIYILFRRKIRNL